MFSCSVGIEFKTYIITPLSTVGSRVRVLELWETTCGSLDAGGVGNRRLARRQGKRRSTELRHQEGRMCSAGQGAKVDRINLNSPVGVSVIYCRCCIRLMTKWPNFGGRTRWGFGHVLRSERQRGGVDERGGLVSCSLVGHT